MKISFISLIFIISVSGCQNPKYMQPKDSPIMTSKEKAIVCFHRPPAFVRGDFSIWDSDLFIGFIPVNSVVQTECEPGNHIFIVKGENHSSVEVELEAGKTYHLICKSKMGWVNAKVELIPVTNSEKITKLMESERLLTLDSKLSQSWITANKPHIQKYITKLKQEKKLKTKKLKGFSQQTYLAQTGKTMSLQQQIQAFLTFLTWINPQIAAKYEDQIKNVKTIEKLDQIKQKIKLDLKQRQK